MTREALPNERHGLTVPVTYKNHTFDVTYNFGPGSRIAECFMRSTKEGNDFSALLKDGCIAISLLLQHGETMERLAQAFGEDRPEGMMTGPASSALGIIARHGAEIDALTQTELKG